MCVKMQGNINKGVPDNGEWLALLTQGIAFAQLLGDAGQDGSKVLMYW